jgi:hypothetical protein
MSLLLSNTQPGVPRSTWYLLREVGVIDTPVGIPKFQLPITDAPSKSDILPLGSRNPQLACWESAHSPILRRGLGVDMGCRLNHVGQKPGPRTWKLGYVGWYGRASRLDAYVPGSKLAECSFDVPIPASTIGNLDLQSSKAGEMRETKTY